MKNKEIPKRRFALEEKDLAIEADENNKVAEEKENRFISKIQQEALENVKHLDTDKALERLPNPTGWRILVLPYKGQGKTKGGIILSDTTMEERGFSTVTGLVFQQLLPLLVPITQIQVQPLFQHLQPRPLPKMYNLLPHGQNMNL